MGIVKRSKLNALQSHLLPGLLASAAWLKGKGYSNQLTKKYKEAGWLESPARGIYLRPGLPLRWQTVVASLAREMERPPHIGGISALEEQGHAHYIPLGNRQLYLYGEERLPSWVHALPGLRPFVFKRDTLFGPGMRAGLHTLRWGESGWELPVSMLERAYLEVLDEAHSVSLEHERLLMEGLLELRPALLAELLEACRSVKVKRLFLALAERSNHAWFKRLDLSKVNLGSGKRAFARKGGILDKRYMITLPRDVDDNYWEPRDDAR